MRIIIGLFGLAFGLLIVWASLTGDFWATGSFLTSDPWGIVSLMDLYLGLFLFGVIIALVERKPLAVLLWCLPLPFLGNLWTVLWFVVRWRKIREWAGHAVASVRGQGQKAL